MVLSFCDLGLLLKSQFTREQAQLISLSDPTKEGRIGMSTNNGHAAHGSAVEAGPTESALNEMK